MSRLHQQASRPARAPRPGRRSGRRSSRRDVHHDQVCGLARLEAAELVLAAAAPRRRRAWRGAAQPRRLSADGSPRRARATRIAARSSSSMSSVSAEEGPSVPSPTGTPAARSSATGAMPQPSSAFERGQCATAQPALGQQRDLVGPDLTACATIVSGPSTPSSASSTIGWRPNGSTEVVGAPRRRRPAVPSRRAAPPARRSRLGEVRHHPAALLARAAHDLDEDVRRDRVRRVRRDAQPRRAARRRPRARATRASRRVGDRDGVAVRAAEDLEPDDRAQPGLGCRWHRLARERRVDDGRRAPSAGRRARRAAPARARRRRRAGACASTWSSIHGPNGSPSPNPRVAPSTRCACGG